MSQVNYLLPNDLNLVIDTARDTTTVSLFDINNQSVLIGIGKDKAEAIRKAHGLLVKISESLMIESDKEFDSE